MPGIALTTLLRGTAFCLLAFLSAASLHSQEAGEKPDRRSMFLATGVLVEYVHTGGEAAQAGLRKGDLILAWRQEDLGGLIASPFDLDVVQTEWRPRAPVTLKGFSHGESHTWVLGRGLWWFDTRPNFTGLALNRYQEGRRLARRGKLMSAAESFNRMERYVESSRIPVILAWIDVQRAKILFKARHWQEANALFENAVGRGHQASPLIAASMLMNWGDLLVIHGDLDRAQDAFAHARMEASSVNHEALSATIALGRLGAIDIVFGNLPRAQERANQVLDTLRKVAPESLELTFELSRLGFVQQYEGNLAQAERYYSWALSLWHQSCCAEQVVSGNLITLANIALERGELVRARGLYLQAYAIEQRVAPLSANGAASLIGLGLVARERGDLLDAERYYLSALKVQREVGAFYHNTAVTLGNLGHVYLDHGNLRKAEDYFRRELAIYENRAPISLDVAVSLNDLGEANIRSGNSQKAETYLLRALGIEQNVTPGGIRTATTLSELGAVFAGRGELEKAEEYYQQALAIENRTIPGASAHAQTLAGIAGIKKRMRDFTSAASYYERSLATFEAQTSQFGGTSEISADSRARYEEYYREYIDLLLAQNKPELAFEVLERSRARTLLETLATAHVDIRKGVDPELTAKERSLQADIKAKSERRIHLLSEKQTDEAKVTAMVKSVEKEIGDLTSAYQDVEGQIRSTSTAYAALTQPQPLSAKQVQQQLLDQDTLLLEYSLGEEQSHVFAVTPDSLQAFDLPGRAEIERSARRVYGLLTAQNRAVRGESAVQADAFPKAVAELSRMVLAPVAKQLASKHLLIVADGALQYIPFAVLAEPEGTGRPAPASAGATSFVPLIVNHEIVNLPSASVLAVLRQQERNRNAAPKAVAVLADPVFSKQDPRVATTVKVPDANSATRGPQRSSVDDDLLDGPSSAGLLTRSAADVGLGLNGQLGLPRLRFSRLEADSILAVTPGGQGMEAVDFNANRAAAMDPALSQYRIVHFATHGLLNSEHPELSGLVFSLVDKKGSPQDGFLGLEDIYNLNLPADLVVLSSCETALGKEISGEGLVGLTRGFMYAGATRVVASLWKVSDAATARLMADFYRAMEHDGLPPSAALRSAQVLMLKQKRWESPYFWAAFQIQGEWR
jgi:CHAT domain-containing protein/Tfp pilus assembly protein PilF